MLNISPNSVSSRINRDRYQSLFNVERRKSGRVFIRLILAFLLLTLIIFFIPWTQNIRSSGVVTTLKPDQRPQTIHSVIAGRIEKWFVQEGDFVSKGDTVLFISEIKDEYFDPDLLKRSEEQLTAKGLAVNSYMEKVKALDNQVSALIKTSQLKLQQAENKLKQAQLKVMSDSIDYQAEILNY